MTRHFLQAAYGGRQGCIHAQTQGGAASSLGKWRRAVNGRTATVSVIPTGGPYDGARVTASLVGEHREWKVDAVHANVPVGP